MLTLQEHDETQITAAVDAGQSFVLLTQTMQ